MRVTPTRLPSWICGECGKSGPAGLRPGIQRLRTSRPSWSLAIPDSTKSPTRRTEWGFEVILRRTNRAADYASVFT